jgi:hypothetical protein
MSQQAYVFEAVLADDPDVSRTVAVGDDQTLDDLHAVLRHAFGWHGDFPYAFRVEDGREYVATPGETADVPLGRLQLEPDRRIEHVVEGPEDWVIALVLLEVRADDESLPRVIERHQEIELEPEYDLGAGD